MKTLLAAVLLSSAPAFAGSLPVLGGYAPEHPPPYASPYCEGASIEVWTHPSLGTLQFIQPGHEVIWTQDGVAKTLTTGSTGTGNSVRVAVATDKQVNIYDRTEDPHLILWNGEPFSLACLEVQEH